MLTHIKHESRFRFPESQCITGGHLSIVALKHVRKMRGGSQAHLLHCSDGNLYVVKFSNNPQGRRVLANEMLASRLAILIGLPVAQGAIVEVPEHLVSTTAGMSVELETRSIPCSAGLQFGSRYVVHPLTGRIWDYMPDERLHCVRNIPEFAGMLAFDKWLGNTDNRQAVFWRTSKERLYRATFIDHGYCFNGNEWNFPDTPLRGFFRRSVYSNVSGWKSFEPWISEIEEISEENISEIAQSLPPQWYEHRVDQLHCLVRTLVSRRKRVRNLIDDFRRKADDAFPLWKDAA